MKRKKEYQKIFLKHSIVDAVRPCLSYKQNSVGVVHITKKLFKKVVLAQVAISKRVKCKLMLDDC